MNNYNIRRKKKKTGGYRTILAPTQELKSFQYEVLEELKAFEETIHPKATAFVSGLSVLDNANHHLNKKVVVNIDLKDFFPSISKERVESLFRSLGFSDEKVKNFTEITTFEGKLPQGAPTSPFIANLICKDLDYLLDEFSTGKGFSYTRYADDLSFSSNTESKAKVFAFIEKVKDIIKNENFIINKKKVKILRSCSSQVVTGILVNGEKPRIPRKEILKFRAFLYNTDKQGVTQKLQEKAKGYLAFVEMVSPEQAKKFREKYEWLN